MTTNSQLRHTPLDRFHADHGARMVDFAGWSMPLQYAGIVAEHQQTRQAASLFDVSHMCQLRLTGSDRNATVAKVLPVNPAKLAVNRNKYTFICQADGGIVDDLIIGNDGEQFHIVCNASRAQAVKDHVEQRLVGDARLEQLADRALLAVQGPQAAQLAAQLAAQTAELYFMDSAWLQIAGAQCRVCRCGYTGEDGFEISVPGDAAHALAALLCEDGACRPAGLGARDSLRLEAGLCLYGQDIDLEVSPVEAGLQWAITGPVRREGDFEGADAVRRQLDGGAPRTLVGLAIDGRGALRPGAQLNAGDRPAGRVTSGGHSPTLARPIALALVDSEHSQVGTQLSATLRGKQVDVTVAALPFVAHNYRIRPRKPKTI